MKGKYNSENGNVIVYVLIVFMFIFTILTTIMYKINRKVDFTTYKNDTENLYYLASSGGEKLLSILNDFIKEDFSNIINNDLMNLDIQDFSYYETQSLDNKFNGDFFMEKNKLGSLINLELRSFLDDNYKSTMNKYKFDYRVEFSQNEKYEIIVEFQLKDKLVFESTCKNLDTNNYLTVDGEIEINNGDTKILIKEKYKAKDVFNYFSYGMAAKEKIYFDETQSIITGVFLENYTLENNINTNIDFQNIDYSENNKVIISNDGLNINISDYKDDSAIIICNFNSPLYLSSDDEENNFKGLIYSNSDIFINCNLNIEGSIYTEKNIFISNNVNILSNELTIFETIIIDKELERKIFDFFSITNYNLISSINKNTIDTNYIIIIIKEMFFENDNMFSITKFKQRTDIS